LSHSYTLPESLKESLRQPFGVLIPDSQVTKESVSSKLVGRNRIIVTVGDRTTERMKQLHIFSNLEIVDGLERRQSRNGSINYSGDEEHHFTVKNPAGTLTQEALDAVKKSLELITCEPKKTVRVDIEGEEDLLTLAVLALFPEQTIVLYGQPDEGLVIVGAMGDAKDLARKTLAMMGVRFQQTMR
jgi:GTP-dependent dephospho-CoA kinase